MEGGPKGKRDGGASREEIPAGSLREPAAALPVLQAHAQHMTHRRRSQSTPAAAFPAMSDRLKAVMSQTGYQLPSSAECTSSASTPGKMDRVTLQEGKWSGRGTIEGVGMTHANAHTSTSTSTSTANEGEATQTGRAMKIPKLT